MSDIGAIDPGRWQFWQDFWRIGATSFVNVTCACADAAKRTTTALVKQPFKAARVGCFIRASDGIIGRRGRRRSEPARQDQDEQNQHDEPQPAAWPVSPGATVRPRG